MTKMKIKHIGWFFNFIWSCIRDLQYGIDCVNNIGLFKENWQDFKTRIAFDIDPDLIQKLEDLNKTLSEINLRKNGKY